MPEFILVLVNGRQVEVAADSIVASAVLSAGEYALHRSVTGEARGPVCGMGICFECRLTIDGQRHMRACQILCRSGMEIRTDA